MLVQSNYTEDNPPQIGDLVTFLNHTGATGVLSGDQKVYHSRYVGRTGIVERVTPLSSGHFFRYRVMFKGDLGMFNCCLLELFKIYL